MKVFVMDFKYGAGSTDPFFYGGHQTPLMTDEADLFKMVATLTSAALDAVEEHAHSCITSPLTLM